MTKGDSTASKCPNVQTTRRERIEETIGCGNETTMHELLSEGRGLVQTNTKDTSHENHYQNLKNL